MTTLMEVYAEAAEVILERGFTGDCNMRKGGPVGLGRAITTAKKQVGYSCVNPDPVLLLSGWVGCTLAHASTKYTQEEAISLLMWAARNADTLDGDPADSPVRLQKGGEGGERDADDVDL